jgi:hypothetical protein
MTTKNYKEKRTYEQYDERHYMLYLNEQAVEYTPERGRGVDEQPAEPVQGFSYTGDQPDGGTLIEAKEATYGDFVSGLIRKQYTADAVEAVQANAVIALKDKNNAKATQYKAEFDEYSTYRLQCKEDAKKVLGLI